MSPRKDIDRLQAEIQELFSEMWQVPRFSGSRLGFRPQVDCVRSGDPPQLTIIVELSGVDPECVKIVAGERMLVVAGERRRPELEKPVSWMQMEIEYGPFSRKIPLSEDVDPGRATATYERGLLQITLPIATPPPRSEPVPIAVIRR